MALILSNKCYKTGGWLVCVEDVKNGTRGLFGTFRVPIVSFGSLQLNLLKLQ